MVEIAGVVVVAPQPGILQGSVSQLGVPQYPRHDGPVVFPPELHALPCGDEGVVHHGVRAAPPLQLWSHQCLYWPCQEMQMSPAMFPSWLSLAVPPLPGHGVAPGGPAAPASPNHHGDVGRAAQVSHWAGSAGLSGSAQGWWQ